MVSRTESVGIGQLMTASGVGFGTSGARGLVTAMTDRVCYLYCAGFLQYLAEQGEIRPGGRVAIAGDFRASTGRILAACGRAISDLGYLPVNCGRIPTPALSHYAIQRGIASLMVTGSHIPDDRNGIKFNKPGGEILKADEAGIREQVCRLPGGLFDGTGALCEPAVLTREDSTAFRHYVARYLDFLPAACLSGCRVLIYEHSTVAAGALREILTGLGADVVRRGYSERFVPVDTEAIRPEDTALAAAWAARESFDMLVSADGDGDRPLVGDARGEWFRGDIAGVLTASFLGARVVAAPVSCNSVLEKCGWFDEVRRTRIGSPYVIEAMAQAVAQGHDRVVGYEANGGFLTMTDFEEDGRVLQALPTRDAVIVPLALLLLARRRGRSLAGLRDELPARFTASDRLQAFPPDLSARRIAELAAGGDEAIGRFMPDLGRVVSLDHTDGLRITFDSQDVVHLRPSGNAPELRCYTESDSSAAAERLKLACMARLEAWRHAG